MMAILKNDKFNNGALLITGVTPTHINFKHVGTGYPHSLSKPEFFDQMECGVFHTQERRVI
jgi:hypothetical protein